MNLQPQTRPILWRVFACFVLSGATSLVYEVLWIRMLGLIFGHTLFAVTTVLTAFMAGLGLGSYLFGRIADRSRNALLLYGLLEGGIGLYCLAIPFLVVLAERLYLTLYQVLHLSHYVFSLTQFGLVFLLLLIPTTLMGATLPVLSRLSVENEATLGRRVGFLYALNTFGAVLGVAGAGYLFLPIFGMKGTLSLAAIVNLGIAALVIYWSRVFPLTLALSPPGRGEGELALAQRERELYPRAEAHPPPGSSPTRGEEVAQAEDTGERLTHSVGRGRYGILGYLAVWGLGLSGAASMIYEVAWSRALALIIGSSTYAFTSMLVAFLMGLALGSVLFVRLYRSRSVHAVVFGALQTAIGLSALLMLPVFGAMPELFLRAFQISLAPGFIQMAQFLTSFAVMILPTLLIGATFPCVVGIATRGLGRVGADVGRVYAVNTLGAVLGAFAAGFLLIPSIGAHTTVKLGILLNLGMGFFFTLGSLKALPARRWLPWAALSAAALMGVYWMPPWDQVAMSSGVAIYGHRLSITAGKVGLIQASAAIRLVFYEDGISATVTVHQHKGYTSLRVNGKVDASTGGDMKTQLMLGHLPLLLHPAPTSVLIIGLGSGVTAAAVARHPVDRIGVIEIEPAVVRASRFFERENRNVLNDPRVRTVIADGRNFLLSTAEHYDVIISEPSNPWIGGIAALFSQEFFALAKRKLKPGGVMLQWVHGYGLAPDDLKMVVKTFQAVFPATTIWDVASGDYLLLGQENPLSVDLNSLNRRVSAMPGLREDLNRVGFRSPLAVLADFLLGEGDTERYASDAALNTDDRLPLEFSAPHSLYLDTVQLNYRIMKGYRTQEFPALAPDGASQLDQAEARFDLGMGYRAKGLPLEAIAQFEKALAADPGHLPAHTELGKAQLQLNLPLKAVAHFEAILAQDPQHSEATYQLGVTYQAQQMPERALEYLSKAVALGPENPIYRIRLATLLRDVGRLDEAIAQYQAARALKPQDPSVFEGLGTAYLQQGQAELAIQAFKEALEVDSADGVRYAHQLGRAYLRASHFKEAVETLLTVTHDAPLSVEALVDLSTAYASQGEMDKAAQSLDRALSLDPYHPALQRLQTSPAGTDSK